MPNAPSLPPRLAAVADAVPPGSSVVDVGTDHGLLPLALVGTGRARRCVALDRDAAALGRARRRHATDAPPGSIVHREGDGLAALDPDDEAETVVVAGLGGRSIARLLARGRTRLAATSRLILQPQTELPLVRGALVRGGWRIVAERLVRDTGRDYVVIVAEPGDGEADLRDPRLTREDWLTVGPCLGRSADSAVLAHWIGTRERLETVGIGSEPAAQARRIVAHLEGLAR